MYASVRRFEWAAGDVDEVMRRVEEDFVPVIGQVPGFLAYYRRVGRGGSVHQYLYGSSGRGGIQQDGSRLCKREFGLASAKSA